MIAARLTHAARLLQLRRVATLHALHAPAQTPERAIRERRVVALRHAYEEAQMMIEIEEQRQEAEGVYIAPQAAQVLRVLAGARQSLTAQELRERTRVTYSDLDAVLQQLLEAGLVVKGITWDERGRTVDVWSLRHEQEVGA